MRNNFSLIFTFSLLVFVTLACNFSFSTANLSDIEFGKNKDAEPSSKTFDPDDEIFAVSSINNAGSKNTIRFRLLFDDVEGAESGEVAYKLEREFEIEGSRKFRFNFSVPNGFAPGKYKVEYVLLNKDGEKDFDTKTATFTISGDKSDKSNDEDDSSEKTDVDDEDY